MTAGLAVGRPAGGRRLFRKMPAGYRCSWGESEEEGVGERKGEPRGLGVAPPVGSVCLSEEKEKSLRTSQKKKEGDMVHDQQGPQFSSCSQTLSLSPW